MFFQIVYIKWEQDLKAPWWDQNHIALGTYINKCYIQGVQRWRQIQNRINRNHKTQREQKLDF